MVGGNLRLMSGPEVRLLSSARAPWNVLGGGGAQRAPPFEKKYVLNCSFIWLYIHSFPPQFYIEMIKSVHLLYFFIPPTIPQQGVLAYKKKYACSSRWLGEEI